MESNKPPISGDSSDLSGDLLPSSSGVASRLRLMCSSGGRIVPRPSDQSLCYVAGETRMVAVDRHFSLSDLTSKLSRTFRSPSPFTLKYQLPNEDLDSLISLTTDEDLDNLIDEYDRLLASSSAPNARSSRIRLFLFPAKSEVSSSAPPSSIGSSLLDDSKSEIWFEDALNSAVFGIPRGMSNDGASVNSLLGLEDAGAGAGGGTAAENGGGRPELAGKGARQAQDVQSVPDSPMLDNSSSFGSASSAPSLSSLPPICAPEHRAAGAIEEQLGHMNLKNRSDGEFQQPTVKLNGSSVENSSRISDDDSRGLPQLKSAPIETLILDSGSRKGHINLSSGYPVAMQSAGGGGYVLPPVPPEQLQQQQQQSIPHLHPHLQQQYVPANAHYIPISPYFQTVAAPSQQIHHHYDPQLQMYYLPVHAAAPYNLTDPNSLQSVGGKPAAPSPAPGATAAAKPELQSGSSYRTPAQAMVPSALLQPQLFRVAAADQGHSYAGIGYQLMQQQQHLVQGSAAMSNFGYEYMTDPAHSQVYYSQTISNPQSGPAQYQATNSGIGENLG